MNKMLRILPFLLVLVIVFGLQVKWDVENKHLPFLDPFGRESSVGTTTVNRPVHVQGTDQYLWLQGPDLVVAQIDPRTGAVTETKRPVPDMDIYTLTTFKMVGEQIFWIGKDEQVKTAQWNGGAWSKPHVITKGARTLTAFAAGGKQFLLTGAGGQLVLYEIQSGQPTAVQSFPIQKASEIAFQIDQAGSVRVGVVDNPNSEYYELNVLTIDPAAPAQTVHHQVGDLSLPSGTSILEANYAIDATHSYFLLTKAGKGGNRSLDLYAVNLAQPDKAKRIVRRDAGNSNVDLMSSFSASPAAGQAQDVPFVFVAATSKNPRVEGYEVFRSTLVGGEWKAPVEQVTNMRGVTSNPVLVEAPAHVSVVFATQSSYDSFKLHYTSSDSAYAAATNQLTEDDYTDAAMSAPQYFGMAFISMFMAFGWPFLSYLYLLYFVFRKEAAIYDHATRHLTIAVGLYVVSQIVIFLNYGKIERFELYAPTWLQGGVMITIALLVMAGLSYGLALWFGRTRYERHAVVEFSYFFLLNAWMVLLGFSYFVAT